MIAAFRSLGECCGFCAKFVVRVYLESQAVTPCDEKSYARGQVPLRAAGRQGNTWQPRERGTNALSPPGLDRILDPRYGSAPLLDHLFVEGRPS